MASSPATPATGAPTSRKRMRRTSSSTPGHPAPGATAAVAAWDGRRGTRGRLLAVLTVVAAAVTWPGHAMADGPRGATARPQGTRKATVTVATALRDRPQRMAEPAVAVDPANPKRVAAAADPYRGPVRIVVTLSSDGGATWGRAIQVVPPGYAKSYDPTLAFDPDGEVVVVGGASQVGPARCQPGSAVFVARLAADGRPRYRIVRGPRRGSYADRPAMALDESRIDVSWTESSGPDAECRGMPTASATMFTSVAQGGTVARPRRLPSSGLPAPFGSAVAAVPGGVVYVAVRERDPPRALERTVVLRSSDHGARFGAPEVAGEGPLVPASAAGLGGILAPIPSLAVVGGRVAVAWSASSAGAIRAAAAERGPDGRWRRVPLPAGVAAAGSLWPTLAYADDGTLYLAGAELAAGRLRFSLAARRGRWQPTVALGSSPARRYLEVGERLGVAAGPDVAAAAVPLDGATQSTLRVWVRRTPSPPPTTTRPPATTVPPSGSHPSPSVGRSAPASRLGAGLGMILAGIAAAAALLLLLGRRRRRSGVRHPADD